MTPQEALAYREWASGKGERVVIAALQPGAAGAERRITQNLPLDGLTLLNGWCTLEVKEDSTPAEPLTLQLRLFAADAGPEGELARGVALPYNGLGTYTLPVVSTPNACATLAWLVLFVANDGEQARRLVFGYNAQLTRGIRL